MQLPTINSPVHLVPLPSFATLRDVVLSLPKAPSAVDVVTEGELRWCGRYDFLSRKITVKRQQNETEMLFTLLHELGHSLMHTMREHVLISDMFSLRIGRWCSLTADEVEADLFAAFVFTRLGWAVPPSCQHWLRRFESELEGLSPRPLALSADVCDAITKAVAR